MNDKKISGSSLRKSLLLLFVGALIAIEVIFYCLNLSDSLSNNIYNSAVRFVGGAVCIIFMFEFSYHAVLKPVGNKSIIALLAILPAFAVAVNNFPFVSYFSGDCNINARAVEILVYAIFCLSVGFFEEMAFRGCVLMFFMKKRSKTKNGIFMAIFISSVVFGLIHLINLVTSSPAAVLLQIGYSALIGALCSLVLLVTKNIWICVLLHAVYNFAGGIVPSFGSGVIWTASEIILTAAVAVAVTVYSVWLFIRLPIASVEDIYKKD